MTTQERSDIDVRDGAVRRPHIIVGVDGSAASVAALRQAVVLAEALNGSVEAVDVWQFPASVAGYIPPEWSPEDDAKQVLAEATSEVFGTAVPSWFEQTVCEGSTARRLVALSRDADLLVMGSRGHGGFTGLLLGSVSSACAEYSHCPTLVMHGESLLAHGDSLPVEARA
ncbi:MAG TPA: universal stress protein [Lacisediminihabitans sp.]